MKIGRGQIKASGVSTAGHEGHLGAARLQVLYTCGSAPGTTQELDGAFLLHSLQILV